MNGLYRAMAMLNIIAAINVMNEKEFNCHRSEPVSGERYVTPKGKRYVYPDGFECYALNQKNADRKHKNFLK